MSKRPRTEISPSSSPKMESVVFVPGTGGIASGEDLWRAQLARTEIRAAPPANSSTPFLCTHHGGFHCDEALALAMLSMLPEFADMPIVRTRDNAIIEQAHLVVDVGGIYNAEGRRFDHHMGDFVTTYSEKHTITKLSSAGLVYKHYGERILKEVAKALGEDASSLITQKVVDKFYRQLIEEIDAVDNGVEQTDKDVRCRYKISTSLGNRVRRLNPTWRNPVSQEQENEHFRKAVLITGEEFLEQSKSLLLDWLPARSIVETSAGKSSAVYRGEKETKPTPDSKIMQLDNSCPWQEHLADLESEIEVSPENKILYVVFPDARSGTYRIQAVPAQRGSFTNRKPLPSPWRGIRDSELSGVVGVEGCVFCHASGFIGGHQTLDGAWQMARIAVEFVEN